MPNPKICGVTEITATGEWICRNPVHDKTYESHGTGKIIFSTSPKVNQHYFVKHYPMQSHDITKE